jgi:hypothetical protein
VNQKVKELSDEQFVAQVLEKDDELAKQVQTSEIDAESIIIKAKPGIDKYGIATGVAFAVARLREAVLEANSEEVKGLLVGQRDRFGTNSPVRIPLLSSKGLHMEMINWGTSAKYGDSKIELPFPSIATVNILSEGDYKGVPNNRLISVTSYEDISVADATSRLSKIAKSVGELSGSDELSVVVVKGKISFIAPATKWKNKEKDGSWQIYMPNQRDTPVSHPVMQISLESQNGNMVRAVFDRQKNTVPTICVEDFSDLCIDAVASNSDPNEQAKFIGGIMKDREVIIVGFVTKFNSQVNVNYIDIGAYALFDFDASAQTTLAPKGKEVKGKKPSPSSDDKPSSAKPAPAGKAKSSPADKLKDKIKTYCELCGVEVADITAETVMENFKLEGVMEKGTVETIIEELRTE